MKRKLAFVFAALMLTISMPVYAADDIKLNINGSTVSSDDGKAVIIDSCTMIPLRYISQLLGYQVDWNPQTKTATLTGDNVVKFTAGAKEYLSNSETLYTEVPAQIVNDRLYLPLRAMGEAAGKNISWDGNTKTAYICDHYNADWSCPYNEWHRRCEEGQCNGYGSGWGGHHHHGYYN